MQGHRFIAAVFLLTLVALGAALPLGTAGYALLGVLGVAVVVYAVLGERHLATIGSTSQRGVLASTIARRALAATEEQRAGIASMEEDIRDAVQRLTGASAGQSARHTLDALPWVLVMGLPQSGKSSMLASSGQPFAYATPSGGARGGRNCRWWITPQCAWIDTGGSYILGEAALPEWLTLLRNLATLRPAQPLHAVVITMAADSIPAARPEDVDAAAKRVRERLDEALGYLGIDVPVYLMVTRSDLLPGFPDFFSDLREAERGQIWGSTWKLDDATPISERLTRGFDELLQTLVQRSLRRMGGRDPGEARVTNYQFPQWFAALRPNLLRFAATLFASNVFQGRVSARGIYFSSAAESMARVAGGLAPTGQRGSFLRDWISHVVLPDHELAGPSAVEVHRRKGRRNAVGALLFSCAVLLSTLGTWSWRENHDALQRFDASFTANVNGRAPAALATLETMRADVELLRANARDDAPTSTRFGLGVADQVAARASLAFAKLIARDVATPVTARLQRELAALRDRYATNAAAPTPADRVRGVEKLRLYRLLTSPRTLEDPQPANPVELDWLTAQLTAEWETLARSASPADQALRARQLRLYGQVLAVDPSVAQTRDLALVQGVMSVLAR
ncbi:MAG: type secretion protein IcmF [Myxococcaceae bacterium]|nr:type secretion protein IcmF [Myxococcaceae bacterium]